MMAPKKIVLAGGGSAGHVNPLLATAAQLRDRGYEIVVLGTEDGLEADLVPQAGFELVHIPKAPFPRRPGKYMFQFPGRYRQAVKIARQAMAGAVAVVGFGGYVATPAYSAAKQSKIPIVIHEQNARPGLANRWGARSAAAVATTFDTPAFSGAHVVGMPLREQVLQTRSLDRAACAQKLGLELGRPTILVSGGSLGAVRLNEAVSYAAGALIDAGAQVFHLTGRGKEAAVRAEREKLSPEQQQHYHVQEYLVSMEDIYALADLVIGRSGAGAVSELTALGIPAIYVPLPVGNGEQRLNAAEVIAAGGGKLVADERFTPQWIYSEVLPLIHNPQLLAQMATNAAQCGVLDGAERLADVIESVIR